MGGLGQFKGPALFASWSLLSAIVWMPVMWATENLNGTQRPIQKVLTEISLIAIWPWIFFTPLLLGIWIWRSDVNTTLKISFVVMVFLSGIAGVIFGPLLHVCTLQVDCI